MQVTFSDTRITLANLIAGIFPDHTAADFEFLSGRSITSVAVDAASDPLFAPGSVLDFGPKHIGLVRSNTCEQCVGGESIYLNVAAVPGPASVVLVGAGLATIVWRRRTAAIGRPV